MKRSITGLITIAVFGSMATSTRADTLYVPGEYTTIQAAIDAAVNGDTVELADGTYTGSGNRDLDFGGRLITVRSANGPENCIIDCEDDGRGFYFHSGETADATVEGFTISNGFMDTGGAVLIENGSSPTFSACRFGYDVALREWPDHSRGRRGLQRCLERMIDFELHHGSAKAVSADSAGLLTRLVQQETADPISVVAQSLRASIVEETNDRLRGMIGLVTGNPNSAETGQPDSAEDLANACLKTELLELDCVKDLANARTTEDPLLTAEIQ